MNKLFSKVAALSVGLAMAVGVGVAVNQKSSAKVVKAENPVTVASWSTSSTVGGEFTTNAASKPGYYQDTGSVGSTVYVQVLNTSAYWTVMPSSISLTVTLGAGTSNLDFDSYAQVVLIDSSGNDLSTTDITNHVTTNTGDEYNIDITPVNNVYGVKIQHVKESGKNIRYYSFSLSYVAGASGLDDLEMWNSTSKLDASYEVNYSISGYLFYAVPDGGDQGDGLTATWSSTDETVAEISDNGASAGFLTIHKPGKTTIGASVSGYNSVYCALTISAGTLESLSITGEMSKTEYTTAESWDPTGFTVTASYVTGWVENVTSKVAWSYSPASPAENVTSVTATATLDDVDASSNPQAVTVEVVAAPITLDSSNWPVTATGNHADAQTSDLDGITYENVGGYKYSNQLSLNYAVNNYFGNKTAYSKNIKSVVVTYSADVTSYVKMYESSDPLTKETLVSSSGTTTVTYTFSDTNPYFRLNMDTSTPKGTYCNITSIVITLGSDADKVDLENISLNGDKTTADGVSFASQLTLVPANANNKNTILWESSDLSVATVDSNGIVTTVGAGSSTITATATDLVGISASYTVTVFEADNPIHRLYYMVDGANSGEFYGYYVGTSEGNGPIIMDGVYGMMLYGKTAEESWEEGTTIVHVTAGTVSIYNGLVEVKNSTFESVESAGYAISKPVTHIYTGSETALDGNRLSNATGYVSEVTKGSLDSVNSSDIEFTFNTGATSFKVYYKKAAQTADLNTSFKDSLDNSTQITIKGFTSWYNAFQFVVNGLVEEKTEYTAEQFAQDLLDQTDLVCEGWSEGQNNHDAIAAIWSDLASADKYPSLPQSEKDKLATADREGSTVVERAMMRYDFLTGKYSLGNFIEGRTPIVPASESISLENNIEDNNMMIIAIIAGVSAVAFGALLLIKKKKHN